VTLDAHVQVSVGAFALDAALTVDDRELVALVGPNGAGKTTLLRAFAGLAAIDHGAIRIGDTVVDQPSRDIFVSPERRSVGVVFQDYLLFPHLSALDNVAFGLQARGARKRVARERAAEWLDRVGLAERAAARPAELSGGEAQRVALARALAIEPALLLMDEPFAALDVQHRSEVRHYLGSVLAEFGGARVMVTHDPVDALTLADRIVIIERGRIVQSGTPDDIVSRPASSYVADLVGVNLYRANASGREARTDTGALLTLAEEHHGVVHVLVAAHAVVLHRSEPTGTARNVWRGLVKGNERMGERVRVRVEGDLSIVAEITAASADALGIEPGVEVWAAVKATEIAVYDA
jgi:molybdate transport system ATP-binding protein